MVNKAAAGQAETCAQPLTVTSWRVKNALFEAHSGRPIALRKHMHDDFQIAINTRAPGRYICDGQSWTAHPGDIVAVHPGEMHSTVGECERPGNHPALLLYVGEAQLQAVAAQMTGRAQASIGFGQRVFSDPLLAAQLARAHREAAQEESELSQDSAMLAALWALLRHALQPGQLAARVPRERQRVERARDFISDHFADSISLDTLAEVVQLSPFQLCRTFSKAYGLSPHSYQTAMRVDRAKVLLAGGTALADAAVATGFYDQSHLHRHFQRIVGVTPGRYAAVR